MILSLAAVLIATVLICFCAVTCSGGKLKFEKTYYFVYYRTSDNAISASSLSEAASNYGGAGYILAYKDSFFVTFACYYKKEEAEKVCSNLKGRDLDCSVLTIETKEYKLQNKNAKNNQKLYSGNLTTLDSLSSLAYECANGLDTGEYSQSKAKQILSSISDTLNGLLKSNANNCFTESIKSLLNDCERVGGGYLLSKNMRYIQIALTDKIIHAELN